MDQHGIMTTGINGHQSNGVSGAKAYHLSPHDDVHFDPSLKPNSYTIEATSPGSKVLFRNVNTSIVQGESRSEGTCTFKSSRQPSRQTVS